MTQNDIPHDVFVDDRHDIQCGTRRFYYQTLNHPRHRSRSEILPISEAEADMELTVRRPPARNHTQGNLRRFEYLIVACQGRGCEHR